MDPTPDNQKFRALPPQPPHHPWAQTPDGKVKTLLGSFQEPGKGLIRLVEANEQNLLHPRDLGTKEEVGRKISDRKEWKTGVILVLAT